MTRAARQADNMLRLWQTVQNRVEEGEPADRALRTFFKKNPAYGSRDRRWCSEVIYSGFRWLGWAAQTELNVSGRLAFSYALDHAEWPPPVVQLAEQGRLQLPENLPALNPMQRAVAMLPGFQPDRQALVPGWIPDVLTDSLRSENLDDWLDAIQERPPLWLRLSSGVEPVFPEGVAVKYHWKLDRACRLSRPLPGDWWHRPEAAGVFIQDVASQAVGAVCAPQAGEHWWDACCGAGGKALDLADRLQGEGYVLASDVRPQALRALRTRLKSGLDSIVQPRSINARTGERPGPFDGVLLDAPCSGVGTWGRNPDARWRSSVDRMRQAVKRQRDMLQHVADAVKPGGRLVYAVCTLTQAETLDRIEEFLAARTDFAPAPFEHPLTGAACAEGCCTIYPWDGPGNGMFVAKLVRR